MKKTIILLVLTTLFSCSNKEKNVPQNLMSEEQMVNFLLIRQFFLKVIFIMRQILSYI